MESSPLLFLYRAKNYQIFLKRTLTTFAVKSSIYESSIKYQYNQIQPMFQKGLMGYKHKQKIKPSQKMSQTVDVILKH